LSQKNFFAPVVKIDASAKTVRRQAAAFVADRKLFALSFSIFILTGRATDCN